MPTNSIDIKAIIESTLESSAGRLMNKSGPNNKGAEVIEEILEQAKNSIQESERIEGTNVQD